MKKAALYSGRSRSGGKAVPTHADSRGAPGRGDHQAEPATAATPVSLRGRMRVLGREHQQPLIFVAGALVAGALALAFWGSQPPSRTLVQEDIDAAVLHTLETKTLPSRAAKAAELVRQAVVRVNGFGDDPKDARDANDSKDSKDSKDPKDSKDSKDPKDPKDSKDARNADDATKPDGEEKFGRVATGVVIVDSGIILTNLHVVAGAKRLSVTFFDGMESEAEVIAVQPENDLAVIRAKKIPDDLPSATLGSSHRLQPGDDVVAVGFPFGIGPSVSAGVVSGLDRGFRSADGKRKLTKLIQFDAAVNQGNSGGPLITMDGEVVGIVTAIFNPTEARTFIGIGFAATIESAGSAVGVPPF